MKGFAAVDTKVSMSVMSMGLSREYQTDFDSVVWSAVDMDLVKVESLVDQSAGLLVKLEVVQMVVYLVFYWEKKSVILLVVQLVAQLVLQRAVPMGYERAAQMVEQTVVSEVATTANAWVERKVVHLDENEVDSMADLQVDERGSIWVGQLAEQMDNVQDYLQVDIVV